MSHREPDEIDRIECIRIRNNNNWMSLLRIAVKVEPKKTLPLLKDILKCDGEVNSELNSLVKKIEGV